jgi:hypothetical protein
MPDNNSQYAECSSVNKEKEEKVGSKNNLDRQKTRYFLTSLTWSQRSLNYNKKIQLFYFSIFADERSPYSELLSGACLSLQNKHAYLRSVFLILNY